VALIGSGLNCAFTGVGGAKMNTRSALRNASAKVAGAIRSPRTGVASEAMASPLSRLRTRARGLDACGGELPDDP
jgi:hypothetical protein